MTGKKAESKINLLLGILESTEDQNPSNNIIHAENFLLDNVLSTLVEESSSKIISDSELPCKTPNTNDIFVPEEIASDKDPVIVINQNESSILNSQATPLTNNVDLSDNKDPANVVEVSNISDLEARETASTKEDGRLLIKSRKKKKQQEKWKCVVYHM